MTFKNYKLNLFDESSLNVASEYRTVIAAASMPPPPPHLRSSPFTLAAPACVCL